MKKRDLSKLAFMGMALGLCCQNVQAEEPQEAQVALEEQTISANCGSNTCGAAPSQPEKRRQNSYNTQDQGEYDSQGMHASCGSCGSPGNSQGNRQE